jgi:hypothetical protein
MKINGWHECATEIGSDKLGVDDLGMYQMGSAKVRPTKI